MTEKTGFSMDWTEFDKKFYPLVEKAIPGAAKKGLFVAMEEMLEDGVSIPPRAPKDKGHLWGSREVEVVVKLGRLVATGAFNIFYAAKWHELIESVAKNIAFKLPGAGPKYLESKMANYKDKYMWIVANEIKKAKV